jgi:crossover junction endodeoxyribonuclease RuvC
MPKNRRILGLDPGFARTGYAIIECEKNDVKAVAYGCIDTNAQRQYVDRLVELEDRLCSLLSRYHPTTVAVERLFFSKNAKTAIAVGQARGVLLTACAQRGLAPIEIPPQAVKIAATGYGRAEKMQIQRMVRVIFHLSEIPKPDDAADALAVAFAASTIPLSPHTQHGGARTSATKDAKRPTSSRRHTLRYNNSRRIQ